MRAGERENCENSLVETVSVATAISESFANVVKIKSFPMGPGAASVARGLQTEPDMEARTRRVLRRGPAYQYA
jgi:hypothetical protein